MITSINTTMDVAYSLVTLAIMDGGTTIPLMSGNRSVPTTGYMVGGVVPTLHLHTGDDMPTNVEQVTDWLNALTDAGLELPYVGSWLAGNIIHVDVCEHYRDDQLQVALDVAAIREELAIYDLLTDADITV